VRGLNATAPVIALSAKTGAGMADWLAWLGERLNGWD